MPARPRFVTLVIFALGQVGWSLVSFGAFNQMTYFFMPPEVGQTPLFPPFFNQNAVLGVFTVLGLVNFGGRFLDGLLDPLVANWSDRWQSAWGKRRSFMAVAAVPLAVFSVLIFMPLRLESSSLNAIWMAGNLLFFYFFFTFYTAPYAALLAELGHDERDRMRISTLLSIAWSVGFLIGSNVYFFQNCLEQRGFPPILAFQWTIGGFAALALGFMLLPVFFLNEKKYALQTDSTTDLRTSLRTVFQNRNFRFFALSDLTYWLALTFIQTGFAFYLTLLLGLDKGRSTDFFFIAAIGSFILYPFVNWLVDRFGKRAVVVAAFWNFSALFAAISMMGWLPVSGEAFLILLAVGTAFPLSAFGIIPNALLSDIVFENEKRTGRSMTALFFAARAFMMKVGVSLANLIFPSFLLLGRSMENPLGVRLSAVMATVFCLVGLLFFRKYRAEG